MGMGLCLLGIATGVLCGIWIEFAVMFQLIPWAGFAGCTTYFAFHERGWHAVKTVIVCNVSGILCAMLLLYLTTAVSFSFSNGVWCGMITLVMCLLGYIRCTPFVPGIFMGCFSTFAAQGEWQMLAVSMACGGVLGHLCYVLGTQSYEFLLRNGILQEPGTEKNGGSH